MISLPVLHRHVDEDERRFELEPVSGKFVDADLEREFEDKWRDDTDQRAALTALVGGLLLLVAGVTLDLFAGGLRAQGFLVAILRVASTVPLIAYGWTIRTRTPWLEESSFNHVAHVLFEGLVLVGIIVIASVREQPLFAETALFCILVLAIHLMSPSRVIVTAPMTGVACVAFEIMRLSTAASSTVDRGLELGVVVLAWLGAVLFNRELEQLRREEFVALTIATEYSERLEGAIQRATDLENELRSQANLDPLTGLKNRRWLFGEFDREFARARRTRAPLSVMILDADHFKRINDSYGHGCGDEVLRMLARVLTETVRGTDALARIGGEEFAVLMPETDAGAARELAERIRARVASAKVMTSDQSVQITISCGVTECHVDTEQPGEALQRADAGLYEAKHRGRDLVITR